MDTKVCSKCNVEKNIALFYFDDKMRNKLCSWCRDCKNKQRREIRLRNKYGLTLKDYDDLFELQNGVCALCGKVETALHSFSKAPLRLAVDHNHKTGEIRGLLCRYCNTYFVPPLDNNKDLLQKLIKYLGDG